MTNVPDFSELKYYLRRYDFPKSTQQALVQLEKLTYYQFTPQHQDNINEIIKEFIFGEVENRGVSQLRFSAVQELQLLEVLCSYFEMNKDEAVQTNVFMALFPVDKSGSIHHRTKLLAQLLSLSIASKNISILNCGAIWMMAQARSATAIEVVKLLVDDYFYLNPQAASFLKDLPETAPLFAANFITAVTHLYKISVDSSTRMLDLPPTNLLNEVTSWVTNYPSLCLMPRLMKVISVQNSPFVITPISGIMKWTVLAPIIKKLDAEFYISNKNSSIEDNRLNKQAELISDSLQTYSKLHLAMLESMIQIVNEKPLPKFTALISSDEIISIIRQLKVNSEVTGTTIADESLNRLGHALQVSLSHRELHGNISEIMTWINQLPQNRLLSILQASQTPKLFAQERR